MSAIRLTNINVRVWMTRQPFSFLVGVHIYKISYFSVKEQKK